MSFTRPIQWCHSHADPFWPDGNFKAALKNIWTIVDLSFKEPAATLAR
jgi:hypothetical protein